VAPPAAGNGPAGLYFKVYQAFGGLVREYFLFTADGRFSTQPFGGVDPFDFAGQAQRSPGSTGTYSIEGTNMVLRFANNKTQKLPYRKTKDGIELEGSEALRMGSWPASTKFDGMYEGGSSSVGGTDRATSARLIVFRSDGTYELESGGTVQANGPRVVGSAGSFGKEKGTYTVGGNTLRLTRSDGRVTSVTTFPFEMSATDIRVNFDGMLLKKIR
jgi:hypothetical protein